MKRLLFILIALGHWGMVLAQDDFDVVEAGIGELQRALGAGEVTSVELVQLYLARIAAYDKQGPALNSIIRVNPEARSTAAALDEERRRSGPRSALHGIPILVKDNYNTTDMPTTNGSVALADFIPNANATQIDKLLEAGAIILAKTNLHEYAYGITTIGSLNGQTRNPYDIRRVPGGSSGGTGAAVAASFGAIGLGSDTCGSIRIPSSFNNLIGLRPSKGLSSIFGVIPLSHTQDVAGPLARSAEDLAILLDIVVGYDPSDPATRIMDGRQAPGFLDNLRGTQLAGLRFGVLQSYLEQADGPTRRLIDAALDWYREQGVEVVDVEIPEVGELISASALIGHEFRVDLDQYLARFQSESVLSLDDIVDRGLYHQAVSGPLVRSRNNVRDEQEYGAAVSARAALRAAIDEVFTSFDLDAMVYPTIANTPVIIGEPQPGNNCSLAANSGLPALSMPVGFSDGGLPVGMELLGRRFQDAQLLALAWPFEQANSPRRTPAVTPPLQNGQAPAPRRIRLDYNRLGVALRADFTMDSTRNRLDYRISKTAANRADVYAATLMIDRTRDFELNDPVVLNLLGPDRDSAEGEYFMSEEFRVALAEERVYLRVFADTLPDDGSSQLLQ